MVSLTVSSLSNYPVDLFDEGIAISLRRGSAPQSFESVAEEVAGAVFR